MGDATVPSIGVTEQPRADPADPTCVGAIGALSCARCSAGPASRTFLTLPVIQPFLPLLSVPRVGRGQPPPGGTLGCPCGVWGRKLWP